MILVKVDHERCNEYDTTVYYVAPDGTTQEQFEADVDAAQEAYLAAYKEYDRLKPQPDEEHARLKLDRHDSSWAPEADRYTVAEIRAIKARHKSAEAAFEDARNKAVGTFHEFMAARGYRELWRLEPDNGEILAAMAVWGHRHGESLDYRAHLPPEEDAPASVKILKIL